jgi:hypothetical protein
MLKILIDKHKNIYPKLENMDVKDCSYQIENTIYTKCIYEKNNQIKFYFFCQMYIYIYLTDIFKDFYIENFLLHVYNSYIQNNIKDIVHCHDYILKNIIKYDCSIQLEVNNYINLINSSVKTLSEYTSEQFKKLFNQNKTQIQLKEKEGPKSWLVEV